MMLPVERLVLIVGILLFSFIVDAIIFYVIGYKSGRKDEGEEWAEKKDYYEWLLQMRKRQDFEGVVEVKQEEIKKNPKKAKKIVKGYSLTCEYCGTPIKKGSVCPECKKAGW